MKKLTKREALRICSELWAWLAENPSRNKDEWPGWCDCGEMSNDCPCCEYTLAADNGPCRKCPMRSLWTFDGDVYCLHKDSPFLAWFWARTNEERAQVAQTIANEARVLWQSLTVKPTKGTNENRNRSRKVAAK